MEELSRLHKDVPFGWALWVSQWLAARRRRRAARTERPGGEIARADWPHLTAPR